MRGARIGLAVLLSLASLVVCVRPGEEIPGQTGNPSH